MASVSTTIVKPISADLFEKALSLGAFLVLIAALIAIGRGRSEWTHIPMSVWAHLATIGVALALTPLMLLRRRGDRLHRILGWVWLSAMFLTALISFDMRLTNKGSFSIIHILSVWTVIQVPLILWHARNHRVAKHRSAVRGMVLGALLIAGFFTFPFGRLLGLWLFR